MNGITIGMALVDFIPVVLFFIAAIILQRDLYNKMVKGSFALLATGSMLVLISGIYKAVWKILYACNICDFTALDVSFFPMQAPGFILVFASLVSLLTSKKNRSATLLSVGIVPIYNSNLIFIIGQTLGCAGMQVSLFIMAKKMKKTLSCFLFILAFVSMLGMGYLSAKFDDSSKMHWIAQFVNIVSQASLLFGVVILHKNGLGDKNIFITTENKK